MGRKKKITINVIETPSLTEQLGDPINPHNPVSEKKERLLKLMNEKNRELKGTFLKFASDEKPPERISFGLDCLDDILGGGLPSKRFNILWGPKGAGKTTLAYMSIAQAQKMGKLCAYIDLERSFEAKRAEQFGVNTNDLVLANIFEHAEQGMDTLIEMCKSNAIDFIVLDSIQGLSPKGEQETKKGKAKSIEDDTMALLARKLSQFFRVSASDVYNANVSVLLIGQARMDLGGFVTFETLSGGHALLHWATLIINIRRGSKSDAPMEKRELAEEDEDGKKIKLETIVGFDSVIKLEKTKITSQMEGSSIHIPYYFEKGFVEK